MSPEEYNKEVQEYVKEMTENPDAYINLKELVERLVEIDEYYNHEPWNLMQILANINLFIPVEIKKE